jgi:2-hydroxy-6-oxonona-2,4-dienedioate hydrolase
MIYMICSRSRQLKWASVARRTAAQQFPPAQESDPMSIERPRHPSEGGGTAQTTFGPIEYGTEGAGVPVLVIHGANGGYDQGLLLARMFAPPGVRVIAPSRFGYLGTALPEDASPTAQAHAHAALLDTLGVDRAVVVGVSAGAPSAVELTLAHPARVAGLILPVPRGYAPGMPELPLGRSARLLLRLLLFSDATYRAALELGGNRLVQLFGVPVELLARASPTERGRIAEMMRSVLPVRPRLPGLKNDAITKMRPLPIEAINVPTLILTTRDDLINTLPAAEFMANRIPGARLVVLDDGGHLFVGRRREVTEAVADFLAGIQDLQTIAT